MRAAPVCHLRIEQCNFLLFVQRRHECMCCWIKEQRGGKGSNMGIPTQTPLSPALRVGDDNNICFGVGCNKASPPYRVGRHTDIDGILKFRCLKDPYSPESVWIKGGVFKCLICWSASKGPFNYHLSTTLWLIEFNLSTPIQGPDLPHCRLHGIW